MLPRVHRVSRGGKVYLYHRVTRAKLPDLPEEHPDFLTAWMAEEAKGEPKAKAAAPRGSLSGTIDAYLSSDDLAGTSAGYRAAVRRHLLAIQAKADAATGRVPMLVDLTGQNVQADVGKLSGNVALARLKAWRRFLKWCKRTTLIPADPSKTVERPKLEKTDGRIPWSRDDVEAFRARWPIGTAARAAFEVLHWTGARVSDARKLTRGMVRDGLLTYRQGKTQARSRTNGEAHVPWTCGLLPFARGMKADRDLMHTALAALPGKDLLILPKRGEGARTPKGLGNTVNKAAVAAGLVNRTAHGLRKTRLIALAEAGATTHQIAAWGGHSSLKEIEHYTELADRRRALVVQNVKEADPARKTRDKQRKTKGNSA